MRVCVAIVIEVTGEQNSETVSTRIARHITCTAWAIGLKNNILRTTRTLCKRFRNKVSDTIVVLFGGFNFYIVEEFFAEEMLSKQPAGNKQYHNYQTSLFKAFLTNLVFTRSFHKTGPINKTL